MAADLITTIRAFEALRGTLVFEDEPSSFEAALHDSEGVSAMTDLADLSMVEAAEAVRSGRRNLDGIARCLLGEHRARRTRR